MKKKGKKLWLAVLAAAVILCVLLLKNSGEEPKKYSGIVEEFYETSYSEYLKEHGYDGSMAQKKVAVDIEHYVAEDGMQAGYEGESVATSDKGSITWDFYVEESGFYNILISYRALPGTSSEIIRMMYLDREICYDGMKQVSFKRRFTDSSTEISVKNQNEVRPHQEEIYEVQTVYVEDSQRRGTEPYKVYLEKGKHSITLESVKEAMEILEIAFESKEPMLTYQETMETLWKDYSIYTGEPVYCQAERVMEATTKIVRSASSIAINNNATDPELVPYHPYHIVYNTIGGDSWKYSGDTIEWTIEVPEEGLYYLAFNGRQCANRGITSYRRLKINGEIPFQEAANLRFDYSTTMKNYVLGADTENGPYVFYFKKGTNTVSLEVVLGAFGETYTQISESVLALNEIYRKVIQITGTVPDTYIDYEIVKKLPQFVEVAEQEAVRLRAVLEQLIEITGEKGENANLVEKMVIQLEKLVEKPESIAVSGELNSFKSNITSLATWLIQISEMPLELNSFALFSQEEELRPETAGFFKKLYYDTIRFFATFFVDDTKVSTEEEIEKGSITVWIPSGRDQAQVLRNLIDERFTPETGISVNLELVPLDVLVPATLAGIGPDVILSIDQTKMMDFAMRNALVDLSEMEGFEEVTSVFYPSALEGVTWQEQIFGLPETQYFSMMFYRTDIFEDLGLEAPKTWEEFRAIIPVLQMNNYEAYISGTGILASMIVQKGGDLYLGEGKEYGIASGLSEEVAMETFEELTEFYTAYKLPVSIDFANRFRTGEVPIGIAEYTEYNRFELLAPEIKGLWSFAPVPGVMKEDGTIDNTVTSGTIQCSMLKAAEERGLAEEAWTFMKWWISTEVQLEYANTMESILGSSARYATANREVLANLPWATDDLEKILNQLEHTRGIPPVPGHYMTSRMIDYTFKNVVTDGMNPRETLYLNIKDINTELTKKREEFLGKANK